MTTARDIIKSSLRKLQVLGVGAPLSSEDASDCLKAINAMIASWSIDGPLIYTESKDTFNLTTGTLSYSIGSGADWDTTRPNKIKNAYVTHSGTDYPIKIESQDGYAEIADKDLQGIPEYFYYDGNYPTGRVYVWPVANSTMTATLFTEKSLTGFATLDTVYALPPEYERAIIFNTAVEVAPEYERQPSIDVKRIAKQSLDLIKAQNKFNDKPTVRAGSEWLGSGYYDINSGRYI